jgi:predicted transcriptional regulator
VSNENEKLFVGLHLWYINNYTKDLIEQGYFDKNNKKTKKAYESINNFYCSKKDYIYNVIENNNIDIDSWDDIKCKANLNGANIEDITTIDIIIGKLKNEGLIIEYQGKYKIK